MDANKFNRILVDVVRATKGGSYPWDEFYGNICYDLVENSRFMSYYLTVLQVLNRHNATIKFTTSEDALCLYCIDTETNEILARCCCKIGKLMLYGNKYYVNKLDKMRYNLLAVMFGLELK